MPTSPATCIHLESSNAETRNDLFIAHLSYKCHGVSSRLVIDDYYKGLDQKLSRVTEKQMKNEFLSKLFFIIAIVSLVTPLPAKRGMTGATNKQMNGKKGSATGAIGASGKKGTFSGGVSGSNGMGGSGTQGGSKGAAGGSPRGKAQGTGGVSKSGGSKGATVGSPSGKAQGTGGVSKSGGSKGATGGSKSGKAQGTGGVSKSGGSKGATGGSSSGSAQGMGGGSAGSGSSSGSAQGMGGGSTGSGAQGATGGSSSGNAQGMGAGSAGSGAQGATGGSSSGNVQGMGAGSAGSGTSVGFGGKSGGKMSKLETDAKVDPSAPLACFNKEECADHHPQGQNGNGIVINLLKSAAGKLGLPDDLDIVAQKVSSKIATSPQYKLTGAVLTLALMAKLKLVPATQFKTEREAGLMYGKLKQAGTKKDAATIRKLIPNAKSLTDEELINLWGSNEHNDLHSSFQGKIDLFKASHITSINSWLKGDKTNQHTANGGSEMQFTSPTPNAADFPSGGANSKGWGFEPGW
jgi:hypothetical protein